MLSLPSAARIFLCTQPTDMRRGFGTLVEMVRQVVGQDPLSGHLFVFRSRQEQGGGTNASRRLAFAACVIG